MKLQIKLFRFFSVDTAEGPLWALFMLLIQDIDFKPLKPVLI